MHPLRVFQPGGRAGGKKLPRQGRSAGFCWGVSRGDAFLAAVPFQEAFGSDRAAPLDLYPGHRCYRFAVNTSRSA